MIEVPLNSHKGVVGWSLISDEDAPLTRTRWFLRDGYATTTIDGKPRQIHRLILGLLPGDDRCGDHINRDKLDNRRENLRVVTRAQNSQNTSGNPAQRRSRHRGVCWRADRGKWQVYASLHGQRVHLGMFEDEDEAGAVALAWRLEHYTHSDPEARAA